MSMSTTTIASLAGLSDAQRRDKVSELKHIIQGQVHLQRFYLSVGQMPERTQGEIDRLNKTIKKLEDDRATLQDALDNHSAHYVAAVERVEQLREEIALLENASKIERLIRLQSELNDSGVNDASTDASHDNEEVAAT